MFGCIKLLLNGTPIREIKEQLHWANQAAGASGRLWKQFTGNNPLVIKLEEWGRFLIIILTLAVVVFFHAARRLHYPLSPSLWLQSASNPEGAVKWEETGLTIRQQIRTPTLKSFFPQLPPSPWAPQKLGFLICKTGMAFYGSWPTHRLAVRHKWHHL